MTREDTASQLTGRFTLACILLLFGGLSVAGITWGLPTRGIDPYLFGDDPPWSGEKIYRLANAGERFSPGRGADLDVDPADTSSAKPVPLTASTEDVARIYLRYRLYTHQPDEMITMMALAGMRPGELNFDPRLYQYGGLFIYPVGALIRFCGIIGLIDVRSDIAFYLDEPEEFGKFYIVARGYAAGWGLVGVVVVFLIGRRLGGRWAGLLAALLFALMPVTVCMAHEGKPHLPGAVLMLSAVLFAMRALGRDRCWWLMCACCGAALGMVLSSLPIFVLIPLLAWQKARFVERSPRRKDDGPKAASRGLKPAAREQWGLVVRRTAGGLALALGVYLITNPYIVINAFVNREVLRSNFGNSLAMYEVSRVFDGFVRVLELTVEGGTLPVLLLGAIALIAAIACRKSAAIPLAVPAVVLFLQFVLIGAGKPAEYGRFGIFTNTAVVIGAACLLTHRFGKLRRPVNWVSASVVILWVASYGWLYLANFRVDTTLDNWRTHSAKALQAFGLDPETNRSMAKIAVLADPAPYGCPPVNFARTDVVLLPGLGPSAQVRRDARMFLVRPVDRSGSDAAGKANWAKTLTRSFLSQLTGIRGSNDRPVWPFDTPISWANKPFELKPLWMVRSFPLPPDNPPPKARPRTRSQQKAADIVS